MSAGYDNRITLQKLEVFCTVVELGSFSRAAEHLYLAQPVVTSHVQSLAKRLGAQLMYRDGRQTRSTEAGQRVYKWASEILSQTRELSRELDGLSSGERGSVAVGASMSVGSYLLPSILADFRERRPLAEITLHVSDPEGALAGVQSGDCDFAVIVGDGHVDGQAISREVIGRAEIVLVAAPDFEPEIESVPLSELRRLPLVSSPRDHIRRELIDRQLEARGVSPENVVIELGHPEAMKRATQRALGVCLLFRGAVEDELQQGVLRTIDLEDGGLSVPLVVVVRDGKQLSAVQGQLIEAVRHRTAGEAVAVPA